MIELIGGHGYGYTDNMRDADAVIVNTCCFIDDAKKESIEVILRAAEYRESGTKVIVTGCMGKRYRDELQKEIPEIDAVFGVEDFENVLAYVDRIFSPCTGKDGKPVRKALRKKVSAGQTLPEKGLMVAGPEKVQTSLPYAYVKIAEGCSRGCSFCVIPSIRGRFRSVPSEDVMRRVRLHLEKGVKEIILVAQDITEYGGDLGNGHTLARLIRDIAALDGDFWLRLLYLHPKGITTELLSAIASNEKICRYVDVPVQHSEDRVLKAMKRGHTKEFLVKKLDQIRKAIPDVVLRTSLIVGFPGETEKEFGNLVEFVRMEEFDRLGVFRYSLQEETRAAKLTPKVPERVKGERMEEIMKVQSEISLRRNRSVVGKAFRALVDEVDDTTGIARLYSHAPEIDGVVILPDCRPDRTGSFADVVITGAYDYDLSGKFASAAEGQPVSS
jgi:ribosomal protein S12 methylthiotransferase